MHTRSMPIICRADDRQDFTHRHTDIFVCICFIAPICNRVNQIFFVPFSHFFSLFVQSSSLMLVANSAGQTLLIIFFTQKLGPIWSDRQREKENETEMRSNSVPSGIKHTHTCTALSDSAVFFGLFVEQASAAKWALTTLAWWPQLRHKSNTFSLRLTELNCHSELLLLLTAGAEVLG